MRSFLQSASEHILLTVQLLKVVLAGGRVEFELYEVGSYFSSLLHLDVPEQEVVAQ